MQSNCTLRFIIITIKLVGIVLLTLLPIFVSLGQSLVIHGSTMDGDTFEKLPSVHVYTRLNYGTFSDIDGNFALTINTSDTLYFSMLGYKKVKLTFTDSSYNQSVMVVLRKATTVLKEVEISDYFQANTIIKLPVRTVYRVPGVKYPENPKGENYRLGVGGAIFSPATAIYRMASKEYKQHKRLHVEFYEKKEYDKNYEKAKELLFEALKTLGDDLDEYYMIDFIHFVGLDLEGIVRRSVYDLILILPGQVDRYNEHILEKEAQN